jgi:membrane protease YdiL (CAAX protease family)
VIPSLPRSQTTLAWLALLFFPALPAYLWIWPRLSGQAELVFQVFVYLYLLAGGLAIGLRWWSRPELGWTRCNFWPGMFAGGLYILSVTLGLIALNLAAINGTHSLPALAWELFFYIALVGLTEEWIFRGLLYAALDEWRGAAAAILGSTLAFGLYHLGSQGWMGVFSTMIFGLFAALVRWRTGSILSLIVVHGLYDVIVTNLLPGGLAPNLGQIQVEQRLLILLADALFFAAFFYIWRYRPRVR